MANRLSHSAISRYRMCPCNYKLHYIDRIRPEGTTSALIFGASLDGALNILLTKPDESAEDAFVTAFTNQNINGEDVHIPTSEKVSYSKADLDIDLLTEADALQLEACAQILGLSEYTDHIQTIKGLRKKESISVPEKNYLNFASWLSLYRKGLLMLSAYRENILPYIEKVHEVQKEFTLTNSNGDKVVGLVDLIADVRGYGTVILDNKTSGRPYERDSARTSEQLALYLHELETQYKTRKVGYIVLNKNVVKNRLKVCNVCGYDGATTHKTCPNIINEERCNGEFTETIRPEIRTQIIIDEMPEDTEAVVLSNIDTVNELINAKEFECNTKQCENWYGSRCSYYNYCKSKSMKGLVKV